MCLFVGACVFFFFSLYLKHSNGHAGLCAKVAVRRRSPRLLKSFLATGVSTVQVKIDAGECVKEMCL